MSDDQRDVRSRVPSRAGILGNPSDGYGGACLAVPIRSFAAEVTCRPAAELRFVPGPRDRRRFGSIATLAREVDRFGYYGGTRLLAASVKRFHDHCRERGWVEPLRGGCELEYRTDIPLLVGLAGSSAIVVGALTSLFRHFDLELEPERLATLALEVETEELGISAGLMDRVIQVFDRPMFMELNRELVRRRGYGEYRRVDVSSLPPLFLAYRPEAAEGSEVTHDDLRRRFRDGEPEVLETMDELAGLARRGRALLEEGRGTEIGPLMDDNFDLRARICPIGRLNRELVETGRRLGAHVKFAGSGGAVVGCWDGDPERLGRLRRAYREMDATFVSLDEAPGGPRPPS